MLINNMDNFSQSSTETQIVNTANTRGGNTEDPPRNPEYQPKSMRRVCFTLNNYTDTELEGFHKIHQEKTNLICYGMEVGHLGTPHLQGYIEFKNPKKFSTVKNLLGERCHFEKARGTRQQNIVYCKKDGCFFSNFPIPLKQQILESDYEKVKWYAWQQDIIDLHDMIPDKRKIYWIVDHTGNNGKSFLARYLVLTQKVLLVGGKRQDVFYQVQKRLENEDDPDPFKMVILDVPRHGKDHVCYGTLETLKNGLIVSSKYEGGTFVFPIPHVVVFANHEPDMSMFSADRWVIKFL